MSASDAADNPASNACRWSAPMVTLVTGERVPSDSPAWQSECEARAVWSMTDDARHKFLGLCRDRRGEDAVKDLMSRIRELEPYFVLALPTLEKRRAYAASVERKHGEAARERLERLVRKIWQQRKSEAA